MGCGVGDPPYAHKLKKKTLDFSSPDVVGVPAAVAFSFSAVQQLPFAVAGVYAVAGVASFAADHDIFHYRTSE